MESVLISALEHWSYCPRQCGLIHLESVWDENVFTIRGTALHERADEPTSRSERGKRVERALPIWSHAYGLSGRADVVEFDASGRPMPVEYKSGPATSHLHPRIQLCAQAICLEEMFECIIPEGAIYYVASSKRTKVPMDDRLRDLTVTTIEAVREMLASDRLPAAKYDRRCRQCSLIDACLPQTMTRANAGRTRAAFVPLPESNLAERELP